ncbi:MAG: undecaprenyldiphospho-muramoylpentapeptide beta-N-acetylglucosaminyltransferase [Holosporales bacterium]|nr:undecaprenyldiphospho-muramoylpentapeptide beta-N-acetylglucosaminyltransferase [Holosporales bacterium]
MCRRKGKNRIAIVAGGTGGHVFPALCVAEHLILEGNDVIFVTDLRGNRYLESFRGGKKIVQNIDTSTRIRLYGSLFLYTIRSIISMLLSRVDCVVGFGGYPSIPFVLAAQILRIKTIIHEQNATLGKANRVLSVVARKVLTSFPDTKNLNKASDKKNITTGNPTRFDKEICKTSSREKKYSDVFTILIIGGSQGARIFSGSVADTICDISEKYKLRVIAQCRPDDVKILEEKYEAAGIEHKISPFFEDIGELYDEADLVISRAGASSIFEIIHFQKPAILIPFPYSINGDQMANAQFLGDRGAAIVIEEDYIDRQNLAKHLEHIINDPAVRGKMSQKLGLLRTPEPTKKIAEIIIAPLPNSS